MLEAITIIKETEHTKKAWALFLKKHMIIKRTPKEAIKFILEAGWKPEYLVPLNQNHFYDSIGTDEQLEFNFSE